MTFDCPVLRNALSAPDRPALIWFGQHWTYGALHGEVTRFERLLSGMGVKQGDRVAVLSQNRPELVFLIHALVRRGAILVPLNARLTRAELVPLVARTEPSLVLASESLADRVEGTVTFEAFARGREVNEEGRGLADQDVRCILFTSGTTGLPKGAELTVRNFRANAIASASNLGGDADQRWLGCLPLFHVGGIALVTRAAEYGACVVLHDGFESGRVLRDLAAEGITHVSLVATALRRLLTEAKAFPASLRAVLIGGGPAPSALLDEARARGLPVLQTYGLTEATSQVTTELRADADGATAGVPISTVKLKIVNERRESLPAGVAGEIAVSGPTVMRGYFQDEAATARVLSGGWLYTGDLGALDERGRLTVLTRRTDLIVTGGENVYPAEVEAVLARHPDVQDVAVTGLDHPEWGQTVVAVVAPKQPLDSNVLADHCRTELAGFKVPRRFVVVDSVPRNAGGKVDRIAVRNLAQKFR